MRGYACDFTHPPIYLSSVISAQSGYIIPDPETDDLTFEITLRIHSQRMKWCCWSAGPPEVKQIMRAKQVVAMMLYLCGFNDLGGPEVHDIKMASFLGFARKNLGLLRSFLHLKLPHYTPPYNTPDQPFATRTIPLGLISSNNYPSTAKNSTTPRHIAVLDLLSHESHKYLVLTAHSCPHTSIADAIELLYYLEHYPLGGICQSFHWYEARGNNSKISPSEERVQTLAYVIRWLVGLGAYEQVTEQMRNDMRPMWERLKWLKEMNENDFVKFKPRQKGWHGWGWLPALKEMQKATD
ncbi:hypothetical protein BGX38DRAFT_1226312 [Terfezia claveryi]|nr:hypothetical protein BGX38DRAFT_1226312 [Terfezia claveryi]